MGSFIHDVEGEILCESINTKIPYFNAPIYLENKTPIGKVDEILGPINSVYFTIKPQEGIQAKSFKSGDKFYIGGDKLLPLEKYETPCSSKPQTKNTDVGESMLIVTTDSSPSPNQHQEHPNPSALAAQAVGVEASAIVAADVVDVAVEHQEDEEDSATVVDEEEAEASEAAVGSAEVEAVVSREVDGVEGALVDVEGVDLDSLCCSLELFSLFFDFSRSCMA